MFRLQSDAEKGDETTREDGSAKVLGDADSGTRSGRSLASRGGGRSLLGTRLGAGAGGGGSGSARARRTRACVGVLGGLVATLLGLDGVASELLLLVTLAVGSDGGVDAGVVPVAAHLTRNRLLEFVHGGLGTIAALACVLESFLPRTISEVIAEKSGSPYRVALVATASDLALSTADLRAGVGGCLAPLLLEFRGDPVGVNVAARADGGGQVEVGSSVLGGDKTGEGRSGGEKRGVEHRGWVDAGSINVCAGRSR